MEYTVVTWLQCKTPDFSNSSGLFTKAAAFLRPERKRANAEIQRLLDDGWKLEGIPVKRGSDFADSEVPSMYSSNTSYVICNVYGQALTRQRPVAIIPPVPVPSPAIIPPVPEPVPQPATLVPPAVNWNRLNARSRANLQTGIPNVLPTNVSGGARKTRKPRRKQ